MDSRIIQGDALTALQGLSAESVHCIVTSPPYYGLRDYGCEGQIGLENTPEEFIGRLVAVFWEARRVLRQDGTLWVNIGDSYANDGKWGGHTGGKHAKVLHVSPIGRNKKYTGLKPKDLIGIPWMLAFALRADGWYLRSTIIWSKPNPMPESVQDRPTTSHEYLFLLSKSPRYYYDIDAIREITGKEADPEFYEQEKVRMNGWTGEDATGNMARQKATTHGNFNHPNGRNKRSVWEVCTYGFPGSHFATFPPALIEPCIMAGTSAKGCCAACGAPWVRVVDRTNATPGIGGGNTFYDPGRPDGLTLRGGGFGGGRSNTLGWQPSCSCNANPLPCVVLDPFTGSGTTGEVSRHLGRSFVGIELNPDYIALAEQRIAAMPYYTGQRASKPKRGQLNLLEVA